MIIDLDGVQLHPQRAVYDGTGWTNTLRVHRTNARGNMHRIWEQFVVPNMYGGPGTAFAGPPSFYRDGSYWVFEQRGGLDV